MYLGGALREGYVYKEQTGLDGAGSPCFLPCADLEEI